MDARRSTLGVAVLNGCIYAVGGFDGSTGLNTAEMFDPQTGKWRQIGTMSTRRSSVGVGVLYGQLYAVSKTRPIFLIKHVKNQLTSARLVVTMVLRGSA